MSDKEALQQIVFMVNKYVNIEDDVYVSPYILIDQLVEFLEENKYTFNVLFDYNDEVVASYKVRGIPTRIAIDKNGEIISIIRYNDDVVALIEENLK